MRRKEGRRWVAPPLLSGGQPARLGEAVDGGEEAEDVREGLGERGVHQVHVVLCSEVNKGEIGIRRR